MRQGDFLDHDRLAHAPQASGSLEEMRRQDSALDERGDAGRGGRPVRRVEIVESLGQPGDGPLDGHVSRAAADVAAQLGDPLGLGRYGRRPGESRSGR